MSTGSPGDRLRDRLTRPRPKPCECQWCQLHRANPYMEKVLRHQQRKDEARTTTRRPETVDDRARPRDIRARVIEILTILGVRRA